MWTTSNMLSMLRGFLTIPMAYALWHNQPYIVLLIGVAAVITDLLDGYLARKLNQVSEAGKIIDPLADKIYVGTAATILIIQGKLALWFGLAVLGRDILIMLGGLVAATRIKFVIPSNYVGKAAVLILCITLIMVMFDNEFAKNTGLYIAFTAMVISFVIYLLNMIKQIRMGVKSNKQEANKIFRTDS